MKFLNLILICVFFFYACETDESQTMQAAESEETIVPETFPKKAIPNELFQDISDNWKRAASVSGSYDKDNLEATGEGEILFNATKGQNLVMDIDHGDLELELDFMVPKGSNSGIYLQGRYEIQILDSWRKENLRVEDLGSVYSDYDEEKQISSNGKAAGVNASKAPGLWQHFSIVFRAPKFDEDGKKIKNAVFEKVHLNGLLIHENIEVPLPTRSGLAKDEVSTGPLMLQGDHGQVAFKNIRYKKMGFDTLSVTDLTYSVFTGEDYTELPNFDSLTPIKQGSAKFMDSLQGLAEERNFFAMIFEGKLNIPKSGDYLFTSLIDDGGEVFINGELILRNGRVEFEGQTLREIVSLDEGEHDIKVTYFQNVWGSSIMLYAEGPEIPKHRFGHKIRVPNQRKPKPPILKLADESVEVQRGYVNHNSNKKTHVLSVGHPAGINYSYDLTESNILNVWRGEFADVSNMWSGRGNSQLLVPLNAVTSLEAGVPIATLNKASSPWPTFKSDKFRNNGYAIDESGIPTFRSTFDGIIMSDKFVNSKDGNLSRSITFETTMDTKNTWYKIAESDYIRKIEDGMYDVGGTYYIRQIDGQEWKLRDSNERSELIMSVSPGAKISYELIW